MPISVSGRAVVSALLIATGAACAQARPSKGVVMEAVKQTQDEARAFDFWMGRWKVHNRRLKERLKGCTEWEEFEASSVARPLLSGLGNEDDFRTEWRPGFVGMTLRLFNPNTKQWAIYWADNTRGTLEPPVLGSFVGDIGTFEGDDVLGGRPIRVRFTWTRLGNGRARWEQAFSADAGATWELNWVMEMTKQ